MKSVPKIIYYSLFFILSYITNGKPEKNIENNFFVKIDEFLNSYVSEGLVRYSDINSERITELLLLAENYSFADPENKDELKAFWINAYNLFAISAVADNYPIKSPLDVKGFFDAIKHKAAGEELTLDQIEKIKLLNATGDPRIHFAIVCAAAGCPEIIPDAYFPESVEHQLEDRARAVINNIRYVNYMKDENLLFLNEIFEWYKDDFENNYLSLINFLNRYRNGIIPENVEIIYIEYDWKLNELAADTVNFNLQKYTPSVLLSPGQFELKMFNNLYTQTSFFDNDGNVTDLNERNTFFTSSISFLYGFSGNINAGIEFRIRSVRNDKKSSSPFNLFSFHNSAFSRTAISSAGFKIKFAPFSDDLFRPLSIQSVFFLPLTNELSGNQEDLPYLDEDAYLWINQFFYDLKIGNDLSYFGEVDSWLRIDRNFEGKFNSFQIPLKSFLNYYPSDKFTFYFMTEFLNEWTGSGTSFYIQSGIGIKYLLLFGFELESLFTDFIYGKNKGAGQTLNIGFRLVN